MLYNPVREVLKLIWQYSMMEKPQFLFQPPEINSTMFLGFFKLRILPLGVLTNRGFKQYFGLVGHENVQ